jgi:hypothetical protein
VQPDADSTVRHMLHRYAAIQEDIARYELEKKMVKLVDGWECCRDQVAEVLGEDDEEEEDDSDDESQ